MPLDNFAERASDGQPALEDDEQVFFTQRDVACIADESAGQFDGPGTVFVSTKNVYWLSQSDSARGFRLKYNWISMHAVSRDPESYVRPCLYCQLELPAAPRMFAFEAGEPEGEPEDDDVADGLAEDPLDEVCELRLVPDDESALTPLFNAMSDGAALNPDPMDEMNEDEGDFIFDGEEVAQGAALSVSQQQALDRWDELLAAGNGEEGQFDDAEDDEYDEEEPEQGGSA